MRGAGAVLAVVVAACAPAPGPVATPVVAARAAPLRFAWPSPLVLRVQLRESSRDTDGDTRTGDHVYQLGYRREGADHHRFWVAGFEPSPELTDPLSQAMDQVAASPSFAIDRSLRILQLEGEAAWLDLVARAPALAADTPQAARARAFMQSAGFRDHSRDEARSEWEFLVSQWWPFFEPPPPGGLHVPEGGDGTWSSTWTRRDEDGVAILTLVRGGPLATAPMPQHLLGLVGVADGRKTLGARGSLALELRTDPATMLPRSLVEVHELVLDDGTRGRLEHRARYEVAATTPSWRPLP